MPFCETNDGTKIFYNDWGAPTAPPVVLISGWPFDADMWEYQAVELASRGLRVIAYDRRGFGRSSQPWGGYDYDTLASDLASLIDKLSLRAPSLVGFSMGGGEVVRYLSRNPGAVKKAALVSSIVPLMVKTADHPEGIDRTVFDTMISDLKKDRPAFLASFGKKFFGAGLLSSRCRATCSTGPSRSACWPRPRRRSTACARSRRPTSGASWPRSRSRCW
jgi:pimeloyl-ACP methyl ester carboxylesterase